MAMNPARMGGASGYVSVCFTIGSSGLHRLKQRLSTIVPWHGMERSTRFRISGNRGCDSNEYVPIRYFTRTVSYYTVTYCTYGRPAMGNQYNHGMLWYAAGLNEGFSHGRACSGHTAYSSTPFVLWKKWQLCQHGQLSPPYVFLSDGGDGPMTELTFNVKS